MRMDAIQEALAEKKPDSRANGSNQFTTPSSNLRAQAVKTPGQLRRDEEINRALGTPTRQSTQLQRNDANVFQSSQPPPANFKLTPLSQESSIHSDEDDPFDNLPLTPPTSQRYKRSRDQESNEESEPDSFRSSPSRNKGKKKANLAHDWITPTTSTKDDTDVFTASTQLVSIIESLEEFKGQVLKLERQMKALRKSNEAKLEKIRDLETDNDSKALSVFIQYCAQVEIGKRPDKPQIFFVFDYVACIMANRQALDDFLFETSLETILTIDIGPDLPRHVAEFYVSSCRTLAIIWHL
ncbi:hypothetical protein F5877DRAFT_62901 [Lentinula edodes]|nr:hypothetical protein F5877DRAFT_62901 [Lentinula edodes]